MINVYHYCKRFDSFWARVCGMWWCIIRRYETELCQHCGHPVGLVYHAPDKIWEEITGLSRSSGGEAAPGILCPQCLSKLAEEKGLPFLRWTCSTTDEVLYG